VAQHRPHRSAPPPVDDEATQVDPEPRSNDDDEATVFTGTPKKARAAQQMLEESRKLNEAPPPRELGPKLHPLIPIGVAMACLFVALLVLNWLLKS
jgi:hypothetical protein